MPSIPFHSRLASSWIAQFRDFKARLMAGPTHRDAWRWHIQLKILNYLILRYGPDPWLDERCSTASSIPLAAQIGRRIADGEPLRSQSELRKILDRIAEINRYKVI